ncbi:MAG: hypothetical protein LC725_02665, partial [Lentisphaerae bacterium]|nr:hypothetical protein [Lentisphaerota bacterium]
MSNRPEEQAAHRELRESWLRKTARPLMIFENYPFTGRGWYLPAFTPMSLGDSVSETKGQSMGEDIWLSASRDFATRDIGFNHFMVYFTARMYWGGPQRDVRDLFDEYCRLFYGPAGAAMKNFFEYCEANWQMAAQDKQTAATVLELFNDARRQVDPDSIYAQRLDLIDQFLSGLRRKAVLLGQQRGSVPTIRQSNDVRGPILIDGHLDEEDWEKCWVSATVGLREMQTGGPATLTTQVKSFWRGNNLYFGITCREISGEPLNIISTTSGDPAIMDGDLVEILLETDMRSYYQIAVNPAGAVFDQDRSGSSNTWHNWDSQCEVATTVADDRWIIEIRLPVTIDENDPLHEVIGSKPIPAMPWHINIHRQRIRGDAREDTAFSPTGTDHVHVPIRFGRMFRGHSTSFDAAETGDFINVYNQAAALARSKKHAEAIELYRSLTEGTITDFQKSMALTAAAASARALQDVELADTLTAEIPDEAVRATT